MYIICNDTFRSNDWFTGNELNREYPNKIAIIPNKKEGVEMVRNFHHQVDKYIAEHGSEPKRVLVGRKIFELFFSLDYLSNNLALYDNFYGYEIILVEEIPSDAIIPQGDNFSTFKKILFQKKNSQ